MNRLRSIAWSYLASTQGAVLASWASLKRNIVRVKMCVLPWLTQWTGSDTDDLQTTCPICDESVDPESISKTGEDSKAGVVELDSSDDDDVEENPGAKDFVASWVLSACPVAAVTHRSFQDKNQCARCRTAEALPRRREWVRASYINM